MSPKKSYTPPSVEYAGACRLLGEGDESLGKRRLKEWAKLQQPAYARSTVSGWKSRGVPQAVLDSACHHYGVALGEQVSSVAISPEIQEFLSRVGEPLRELLRNPVHREHIERQIRILVNLPPIPAEPQPTRRKKTAGEGG